MATALPVILSFGVKYLPSDNSKENREFIKTLHVNLESNAKEQRHFTLKIFGLTVTVLGVGLALAKAGILV